MNSHYIQSGDNSLLKAALYAAYKTRCYLCRTPGEFKNMEIDHIVPRALKNDPELPGILQGLGFSADMNLDDPANLAIACIACNKEKADRRFISDVYMLKVETAKLYRDRVVEYKRRLVQGGAAVKSINSVMQIDLSEAGTRGVLAEFAPVLVQKIASLVDHRLEYSLDYWPEFPVGVNQVQKSRVSLDVDSRSALDVLSLASNLSHDDVLQGYSAGLITHFDDSLDSEFEPLEPDGCHDTLSAYSIERVEYNEFLLSAEFDFPDLLLCARSELAIDVARSLTRSFPTGETGDYQVEGSYELTYQSVYRWDLEEGAGFWSEGEEGSMQVISIDVSPN